MITGRYDSVSGAKIDGAVYLPEPVDTLLPVTFLVDTGAVISCLSRDDLSRLDVDALSRLRPDNSTDALRGIGCVVNLPVTDAPVGLPMAA